MHMTRSFAHALWIIETLALMAPAARAQSITLDELNGKQITFSVLYNVSGVNARGHFTDAQSRSTGQLQISADSVSGTSTRVVTYQGRTVGTLSGSLSGTIGKPQQGVRGGNYVWLLQDNSLIMLRAFAVGGMKITITFSGNGCSVQAPLMHEVGAGDTRMASTLGGQVEVTSATLVSTSCSIGG